MGTPEYLGRSYRKHTPHLLEKMIDQQEQYELICPKVRNKHKNQFWHMLSNLFSLLSLFVIIALFVSFFRPFLVSLAIWHIQFDTYTNLHLASDVIIAFMIFYGYIAYLQILHPKYNNLMTYYYGYKLSVLSFTILTFYILWSMFFVLGAEFSCYPSPFAKYFEKCGEQ